MNINFSSRSKNVLSCFNTQSFWNIHFYALTNVHMYKLREYMDVDYMFSTYFTASLSASQNGSSTFVLAAI